MKLIRGSELQDFLRCRLRWKYAWVDGLRPKKPNAKLLFGTAMHKWLEVYYSTRDTVQADVALDQLLQDTDTSRMDEAEYQEVLDLLKHVRVNYHLHYRDEDADMQVIATELTFAIPLDDELVYIGTIDLIYRDKDGRIWFSDYKTTTSIDKYDKNSDMDRQISRYWWALQQLKKGNGYIQSPNGDWANVEPISNLMGWTLRGEIGGFIYNIILKDFPVPPKVLQKGGLSKDKSQKTTYEMYCQAIEQYQLNACEYADFLTYLQEHPREFFRRTRVFRGQQEIDAAIAELRETSKDMVSPRIYRNITSDCSWDCPFREICIAGMDGSDVGYLIDSLYTKEENTDVGFEIS